jgi:hypothetical protein
MPCGGCRHAGAAAALARAHGLCDTGSQEQAECRRQLLACARRLTRAELAAGLLQHMAPSRHPSIAQADVELAAQRAAGCGPEHGPSSTQATPAQPEQPQQLAGPGAAEQPQQAGALVLAAAAGGGCQQQQALQLACPTSPTSQQQEAAEELLEALFGVVKEEAARQQQGKAGSSASSSSDLPGEYASWLLAGAGSCSSSGSGSGSGGGAQASGAGAAEWRCQQLWAQLHLRRRAPLLAAWHSGRALELLHRCTAKVRTQWPLAAASLLPLSCYRMRRSGHALAA